MRRRGALAIGLLVVTGAHEAHARPADLAVRSLPVPAPPGSLAMRATAPPAAGSAPASAPTPSVGARIEQALASSFLDADDSYETLREQIVFFADVGFGVDSQPARDAPPSSGVPRDGAGYDPLRIYSFGDAVIGSRGLPVPSLASYFAASWRVAHYRPAAAGPVPTVYDGFDRGSGVFVRSGYGEVHEAFSDPRLRPLFVRLGRQFHDGPAIVHFDGVTIGYDAPRLRFDVFGGEPVSLYGAHRGAHGLDPLVVGGQVRIALRRSRRTPVTLSARGLVFDGSRHLDAGVALGLGRRAQLLARLRSRGQAIVRHHLSLRARLNKVSTLRLAIESRRENDWVYDLVVAAPSYDDDDPRRYLSFGAPLPRTIVSLRGGTVVADNLDVLLRVAVAVRRNSARPDNSLFASYLEGGAAVEGRIRRRLRLGTSLLARRYRRADPPDELPVSDDGIVAELPLDTGALGERSFLEADASVTYVRGARELNARAEVYARAYRDPSPLRPEIGVDARPGARFSVDAWAGDQLRLRGEYETAFLSDERARELRGLRSLRIVVEGQF